jgi:hypothetical protein
MSSHLIHRNLRPPVLTITKCIGLPHFGQIGRGEFLGIGAHAESRARVFCSQSSVAGQADDKATLPNYCDGRIKKEWDYVLLHRFWGNRI